MISHKWLYLADIFEHQIMLMNNLRNFPPVTLGIFQSTLLQEERLKLKYIQNGNSYFNPRSYKRSDSGTSVTVRLSSNFNPRSYKRSDNDFQSRYSWDYDFNPRSYKRSDIVGICLCVGYVVFQSTLLQEERPRVSQQQFASWDYFNPRSYKRSDSEQTLCSFALTTFQSTLLQEERRFQGLWYTLYFQISIHAPTRGATR